MYNIKFNDYVPCPKPATSDRIVAAHYYAAWKKGAAEVHEGFDDLADEYPDRTPLMGYYDEGNPEIADWEIKWALEHGINCFIYCWYRYSHNFAKPVTESDLRCAHGIHEALFRAKYGSMMKFAIMYECSSLWGGTNEEDLLENLLPFWFDNYFTKENYLVLDNKPILFIYDGNFRFENEFFADAKAQRRAFDACREYAKSRGFDGMLFAYRYSVNSTTKEQYDAWMERGYDITFGYSSGYALNDGGDNSEDVTIQGQLDMLDKKFAYDDMCTLATASCAWAPEPRYSERWCSRGFKFRQWGAPWWLSPEGFRTLLHEMKKKCDALPENSWGKRIFMLDNWNEWDEGHFIAPSHKYGFGLLQAVREEFTLRDNLPDYRTPSDQGFGGYNTSWREPDFAQFCREKYLK